MSPRRPPESNRVGFLGEAVGRCRDRQQILGNLKTVAGPSRGGALDGGRTSSLPGRDDPSAGSAGRNPPWARGFRRFRGMFAGDSMRTMSEIPPGSPAARLWSRVYPGHRPSERGREHRPPHCRAMPQVGSGAQADGRRSLPIRPHGVLPPVPIGQWMITAPVPALRVGVLCAPSSAGCGATPPGGSWPGRAAVR